MIFCRVINFFPQPAERANYFSNNKYYQILFHQIVIFTKPPKESSIMLIV